MISYAGIFIFGIIMICSWFGWGYFVAYATKEKISDPSWFIGLGLAFFIIIGGFLNIFSAVSKTSLLLLLSFGLILFFNYLIYERKNILLFFYELKKYIFKNKVYFFALSVLFIAVFFKYTGMISYENFNGHDDYQGYFVFPEKMIQSGSMGNDPYSERRLVSSIGGQYFLDTFVLLVGSDKNLAFLDRGVAYLALVLTVSFYFWKKRLIGKYVILVLLIASFFPVPIVNITSFYTAIILFILAIRIFYEKNIDDTNRIIFLSLVISAVCALKNSFAIVIFFLIISFFSMRMSQISFKVVRKELFMSLIFSLILIFPWLLSSYNSSGTFFYPILGKGFHGSVYGDFLMPTSYMGIDNIRSAIADLSQPLLYVLIFLAGLFFISPGFRKNMDSKDFFAFIWVVPSLIVLTYFTGGYGAYRYNFPFLFAAMLMFLIRYLEVAKQEQSEQVRIDVIKLIIMYLALVSIVNFIDSRNDLLNYFKFSLSGKNIFSKKEIRAYNKAQSAVPRNEKILVRTDKNFLFNFKRNDVFIADYPGGSSLPPGLPFQKGAEAMARYLQSNGINYIIYSYRDEASFSFNQYGDRLNPGVNAWIKTEAEHVFDFNENLHELGNTRKRLYDNGDIFTLDLSIRI